MQGRRYFGEGAVAVMTSWAEPETSMSGLVLCPFPMMGTPCMAGTGGWVHEIYRMAYEQAQAALRPSRYERLLVASVN